MIALLLTSSTSAAQARPHVPDEPDVEAARRAFDEGELAAVELRWADAAQAFSESYARSGAWSALYNAGLAFRALERHREARDAFDRLLSEHAAAMSSEERAGVETLREESQGRLAHLELYLEEAPHEVEVDGEAREDDGSRPLRVEVVGGQRSVLVLRAGFRPFTWRGAVSERSTFRLDVILEPEPVASTRSRWPAVVGVVVGVVLAATVFGVVMARRSDGELPPPLATTVLRL
ncbi:MAG: hypothetical protein KF901_17885 [Myxococcales bacterium]|nr:hypothetical protein [Myxococcales bacterium]